MAIESISGVPFNRSLPTNTVSKDTAGVKQQASASGSADTIDFTNASQDIKSAIAAGGASAPVINEDRVAAIKAAVQSGSYTVNAGRIAEKLVQFDNQLPNST